MKRRVEEASNRLLDLGDVALPYRSVLWCLEGLGLVFDSAFIRVRFRFGDVWRLQDSDASGGNSESQSSTERLIETYRGSARTATFIPPTALTHRMASDRRRQSKNRISELRC